IDVRRVPSLAPGYCYGSRVMYVDKQYFQTLHEDIYDSNMKLWKIYFAVFAPASFRNYSPQMGLGSVMIEVFDVQNDHASYLTGSTKTGRVPSYDDHFPKKSDDAPKSPPRAGLMQLRGWVAHGVFSLKAAVLPHGRGRKRHGGAGASRPPPATNWTRGSA